MTARATHEVLLERDPHNPILTAADWPYPVHSVFNAGATRLGDGTTLLLCRVEDRRGLSHLCAARSTNGRDGWTIDPTPTLAPDPEHYPEELWGIEDPRITLVPELGKYVIAYTAFSKGGPGVALALTARLSQLRAAGAGDAARGQGRGSPAAPHRRALRAHSPAGDGIRGARVAVAVAGSHNWGHHKPMLQARRGGWWDANKVGLSPPLIETPRGWLMIYHGVRHTAGGCLYRLGLALFDLEHPEHCLRRGDSWIFGPEEPYERVGDVGNVAFPCGYTLDADGDGINVYYGAADTSIALATGSIRAMLRWLDEHGSAA